MSLDAQLLAAGSARRDAQRNRPLRRGHVDLGPQRRLAQRDRHAHVQVVAVRGELGVRRDVDRQQDVAGRARRRRLALAAQADLLAVVDAGRNLDGERFGLAALAADRNLGLRRRARRC